MTEQWFIARDKKKQGPYSLQQMLEFASSGTLTPSQMVMKDGTAKWTTASTVFFQSAGKVTPTPTNPAVQPSGGQWWKLPLTEVREVASTTWGLTYRCVNYLKHMWQRRSSKKVFHNARVSLAERINQLQAARPDIQAQIVALDNGIRQAEAAKQSPTPLKLQRQALILQIADAALEGVPPPGTEAEHKLAKEARRASIDSECRLKSAKDTLAPQGAVAWRRTGIGFGAVVLLLVVIVLLLFSGGRQPLPTSVLFAGLQENSDKVSPVPPKANEKLKRNKIRPEPIPPVKKENSDLVDRYIELSESFPDPAERREMSQLLATIVALGRDSEAGTQRLADRYVAISESFPEKDERQEIVGILTALGKLGSHALPARPILSKRYTELSQSFPDHEERAELQLLLQTIGKIQSDNNSAPLPKTKRS